MQLDSPQDTPTPNSSSSKPSWPAKNIDLLLILALLSAFFYKSVFLGKPIARLGLIAQIDQVFNLQLKDAILNFRDPSGYLIFFPNGFMQEHFWSRLIIPLWNPYLACGYPMLGDPQSMIHSAAHLLALYSSPAAYNYGLLIEIALGGLGMILLGRLCKLSLAARLFAAQAYVLSPRVLFQIDISGNECFFPAIFAVFLWMAKKPSYIKAALSGLLAALFAFAGHPETIFLAVCFAGLFAFFYIAFTGINEAGAESLQVEQIDETSRREFLQALPLNLGKAFSYICMSALVCFAVAAPLVFPFLQFMQEASIYKEGQSTAGVSSWLEFFSGFYAGQGYEPFSIGSVAALLAPIGLICLRNRLSLSILATLLCAFFIAIPPAPLLPFFAQKPLSYLATSYAMPDILLLLAVSAGLAMDRLSRPWSRILLFSFWASLIQVIQFPLVLVIGSGQLENFAQLWKQGRFLFSYTCIPAILAALFCLLLQSKTGRAREIACAGLISMNFLSLALPGRTSLPVNPVFEQKAPETVEYLMKTGARCTACGPHLFLPNSNQDFFVRDFRCFSPLLPKRYLNYLKAAGAQFHNLYFVELPLSCSPLLDLASVKYILTRSAIRPAIESKEELEAKEILAPVQTGSLIPGIRLLEARLYLDKINNQINADLSWRIHDLCKNRYALQYFIADANGALVWSDRELIPGSALERQHIYKQSRAFPIPLASKGPYKLAVRIKDSWSGQVLSPLLPERKVNDGFLLLAGIRQNYSADKRQENTEQTSSHFKLAKEFAEGAYRIYENKKSLPEAYLCSKAIWLDSSPKEKALDLIKAGNFTAGKEVILEGQEPDLLKQASNKAANGSEIELSETAVQVERPDCNTVLISCRAARDCFLVLNDSYYPGWKCYIDGKETDIYPANYLFRSVQLPEGAHKLRFVFFPPIYSLPLICCLSTCLLIAFFTYKQRKAIFG